MALPATLTILPGLLCDAEMFGGLGAGLPPVSVVGGFYGAADSLPAMAAYALARLPGRGAVLGHSMGARVALEMWRQAPDRISHLILADTGTHPVGPGEREKRHALRDIGRTQGFAALVEAWLPPMVGEAARADQSLMEGLRAMCMRAGQPVYEAQIAALLSRPGLDDLLPRITCPTLLVVGEEDAWSPVEQHRAIATVIPGAELRIVPGAGHMLPAEDPQALGALLAEWLGAASGSGPGDAGVGSVDTSAESS